MIMINWWYIEVELEKQLDLGLGYVRQRKSLKGTLESEIDVRRTFINLSIFSHPYCSYFGPYVY